MIKFINWLTFKRAEKIFYLSGIPLALITFVICLACGLEDYGVGILIILGEWLFVIFGLTIMLVTKYILKKKKEKNIKKIEEDIKI